MAGYLGLSVFLIAVHLFFVAGGEYCADLLSTYCEGDKYCCNYNNCCRPLFSAEISGIVIGTGVFATCVVGVALCLCRKKGQPGRVINTNPIHSPTSAVTVLTVQQQYQQCGPLPSAYDHQQLPPPYQPCWQPPNQMHQNYQNTVYTP